MKREKIQQLEHLIAGIITLVYGFDALEAGEFSSAASYLSLAIIFLIVAGTHKWIGQKFMHADVAFHLLEGITIIYCGWSYKNKGHQFIYYSMAVAGCLYLIFAIVAMFQKDKPKHRSSRRKKRRRSSHDLFKETGKADDNNQPT